MLERIVAAGRVIKPDAILDNLRIYNGDRRSDKLSAVIGEVRTRNGEVFVPTAVSLADARTALMPVSYIGPSGEDQWLGERDFLAGTARWVFGTHAEQLIEEGRLVALGTVGGTSGISVFTAAMARSSDRSQLLIGAPSWSNHDLILRVKGIDAVRFNHMRDNRYDMAAQLVALAAAPPETVVLYHAGKSHNPTGVNPATPEEWQMLADRTQGRLAFFDTPYAGLVGSLAEDTECIRIFLEAGVPVAVAVSFSKNAGLYNLRTGALFVVAPDREAALSIQKLLNDCARVEYSSPAVNGERIMAQIYGDPGLSALWETELAEVAVDIKERRRILAASLPEFSFLAGQAGIFSLLPLTPEQINRLRVDLGVYILPSGRICIGSLTPAEVPRFAAAVRQVL